MTDTDLIRDEVDRLESGIPDHPDLPGIRADGARIRRTRRLAVAAGAGALVAAVAVPAAVLLGGTAGGSGPDAPAVAAQPADPAQAGPSFGTGMGEAVTEAFPGATMTGESAGDRWVWRDETTLDWDLGDPPRWSTLFAWSQEYDVDGLPLDVVALRESPSPVVDPAAYGYCRDGLFVVEKSCRVWEEGDRTLVVHDGTQARGQAEDVWLRTVEVYGAGDTESMTSHTSVSVIGSGDTWAQARASLPGVADLAALALDDRLVLPEPERYPREFPADRPRG